MSRRDIADYLGLTQETLSRVIRQMLATGELVAKGPRTILLKRQTVAVRQLPPNPQAALPAA